jgi:hypothetical protein
MVRKLLAVALLATLAACAGNPAGVDDDDSRGGSLLTSGG